MRLHDRITGRTLNGLPEVMHSGRYLLRQVATLNRHTQFEVDDLLCSDGAERCQLAEVDASFVRSEAALAADAELFAEAITTIAGLMAAGDMQPSPLLPTAMIGKQSHITALEQLLGEVLKAGHLHSISKRPRIDLRYEQSVTEVSRARRLTHGSYTHLASHSECWQRQTLSGVQPRRVLARFSEDDYVIYENRVYARLLDGLDNHLTARLRRLEALRNGLERALRFSQSAGLDHRLSREICELWGSTYSEEQTRQQLAAAEQTLEVVTVQLKSIRSLKQAGLYLQVPRLLRISPVLHRTNILTHDQHYRHLALLWDELHLASQRASRTPAEVLEANQQLERNYSRYAGLVLRHALRRYGLAQGDSMAWAGRQLSVRQQGFNWLLQVDESTVLELVPWACQHALPEDAERVQLPRVICWPGIEQGDCLLEALTGSALRLSPMDLYVVERMGYLVDQELGRVLLGEYAAPIQPLPKLVEAGSEGIAGLKVRGSRLQVLAPLTDGDANKVQALFDKHTRPELAQTFDRRLRQVQELGRCPVCGSPAPLNHQTDDGFSSRCQSCDTKRYWHKGEAGLWAYQQRLTDEDSFRTHGRRSIVFSMPRTS